MPFLLCDLIMLFFISNIFKNYFSLIQKMRIEQAKESRDIAALTKEFTQRLSLVENQLRETTQVINYCYVNQYTQTIFY